MTSKFVRFFMEIVKKNPSNYSPIIETYVFENTLRGNINFLNFLESFEI